MAALLVMTGLGATLRSATGVGEPAASAPSPFRPIAAGPLEPRVASSMVSLGSDVFVWGGQAAPDTNVSTTVTGSVSAAAPGTVVAPGLLTDGAIYSPATDSWRPIAPSPLPGRVGAPVVVTQAGVLVVGGSRGGDVLAADRVDGALYDPVGNTWTQIPDAPMCASQAVAQGPTVWAAGTRCGSDATPAFATLDAMTGVWQALAAPPLTRSDPLPYQLLEYHGTVVAVGRLGETDELSPAGHWTALPSLPGAGSQEPVQSRITDFVTASDTVEVLVVGQVDFGDRGTVVYALANGKWNRVGSFDQHAKVRYPTRFGVQAAVSGAYLVWHAADGLSWFSLASHAAGFAATSTSDVTVSTPTPLVPIDGHGFLWWGGHTGELLPRTHEALSAGALVTITP